MSRFVSRLCCCLEIQNSLWGLLVFLSDLPLPPPQPTFPATLYSVLSYSQPSSDLTTTPAEPSEPESPILMYTGLPKQLSTYLLPSAHQQMMPRLFALICSLLLFCAAVLFHLYGAYHTDDSQYVQQVVFLLLWQWSIQVEKSGYDSPVRK